MLYCWKLKINWWISVGSTSLNTMWRLSINRIGAGTRRHLLRWNSGFSPEANSENVITNFSPAIPVQNRTDETKIMHKLCSTDVGIHKNLRMYSYSIEQINKLFSKVDITIEIYITRLLAALRPSSLLIVNIFLWYIMKKTNKKSSRIYKKFVDFQTFMLIEFCYKQIFEILIIHKSPLGSRYVPHKIWSRLVQPFWHLLDTDRQAKYI